MIFQQRFFHISITYFMKNLMKIIKCLCKMYSRTIITSTGLSRRKFLTVNRGAVQTKMHSTDLNFWYPVWPPLACKQDVQHLLMDPISRRMYCCGKAFHSCCSTFLNCHTLSHCLFRMFFPRKSHICSIGLKSAENSGLGRVTILLCYQKFLVIQAVHVCGVALSCYRTIPGWLIGSIRRQCMTVLQANSGKMIDLMIFIRFSMKYVVKIHKNFCFKKKKFFFLLSSIYTLLWIFKRSILSDY